MDLPQLRAFVALAELKHFGHAAARLHITQPALTKRLRSLEITFGTALFERDRTGTVLTSVGETLLAEAARITAEADALLIRARNLARGLDGHLDIGFGLSTIDIAPRMVAAFRRAYPAAAVSLNDFSSAEQIERIEDGRLDLGFVRLPVRAPAIVTRRLATDRLALAFPVGEAVAPSLADPDAWNEIGFILLRRERGPGLRTQIDAWCTRSSFRLRVTQVADDIQTVLALVAAGVGVSIVPQRAALLKGSAVALSPLPGAEAEGHIGAAWRREPRSPTLRNFIGLLAP